MLARQIEQQACQLARDAKTLVHWLAHVILALAGPGLVDRQGLFDFVVAELQHREHLDPPRIRPVRRALEKQRDDLLAFAGVLDHKLACIARDCDVPRYLVRDLCLLQRKSPSSSAYWQRWNLLHKKLAGKSQRGADAVVDANETHSSRQFTRRKLQLAAAQLFFPPPSIGRTLSQPIAVLPQSLHLPSQSPSLTCRQKPKRIDDRTKPSALARTPGLSHLKAERLTTAPPILGEPSCTEGPAPPPGTAHAVGIRTGAPIRWFHLSMRVQHVTQTARSWPRGTKEDLQHGDLLAKKE